MDRRRTKLEAGVAVRRVGEVESSAPCSRGLESKGLSEPRPKEAVQLFASLGYAVMGDW